MNITIGNEFERRIAEKVESGLYTSASEVIRDGLRLLFEKDLIREQQAELLKQQVTQGFMQLESGQTVETSVMEALEEAKTKGA